MPGMADNHTSLAPFYRGWDRYQTLLVEALGTLSDEQLALRAAPSLRPVWVLAAHIISARVAWVHRVLGAGSPELAPLIDWDDDNAPKRDAATLVQGLAASWGMIQDALDRWTSAMLDDAHVSPRGSKYTRQWVIWHVIEHDLHHGGELFFTLGMHGLPTPDL